MHQPESDYPGLPSSEGLGDEIEATLRAHQEITNKLFRNYCLVKFFSKRFPQGFTQTTLLAEGGISEDLRQWQRETAESILIKGGADASVNAAIVEEITLPECVVFTRQKSLSSFGEAQEENPEPPYRHLDAAQEAAHWKQVYEVMRAHAQLTEI